MYLTGGMKAKKGRHGAASYTYTFSEGDGELTLKFIPDPNMPPVDGNGVYEISTREQLNWAARNNTLDYRLMNDIAIDGYFSLRGFSGTFDGNGHKLTGLTFNITSLLSPI